jgi:hypothetical protein
MKSIFKIAILIVVFYTGCTSEDNEEKFKNSPIQDLEIKTTLKGYLSPYYRVEIRKKGKEAELEFDFYNKFCLIDI